MNEQILWGKNTELSLNNFPIGNEKMPKLLIESLLQLKQACAKANGEKGVLEKEQAVQIINVVDELLKEDYMQHFPLSIWQTGSGTQTNMNANEVIANLANLKEDYKIHPNDHVNMGQSSNDTFPSAMHITAVKLIEKLLIELENIKNTLNDLENKYASIIKTGRTHLQDATPISFSQEISAWKHMFIEGQEQIKDSLKYLKRLPIGATAVGTGLNSYINFDQDVCDHLNNSLNCNFIPSKNKFHGISSKDAFVFSHAAISTLASNTLKMINDIRWLASGPRLGLGEITIPANEPGSSIMPGKVNPTQIEALSMVCVQVMANQNIITIANSQGNFQLNAYMPLIMNAFHQSTSLLSDALNSFNKRCLIGLEAKEDVMKHNLENSLMTATFLNQKLGYDTSTQVVKYAHDNNLNIKEAVLEFKLMDEEDFDKFFDYQKMIKANEI